MVEREEEQLEIKVNDKRKFNLDGSLREGVTIETPAAKEAAQPTAAATATREGAGKEAVAAPLYEPSPATVETYENAAVAADLETTPQPAQFADDDDDYPGADDPASFVNFLSTLATNAAASLGAMPHPVTGQRSLDLETGKYWLDVLAMLKDKTKNNLHPQEARLLEGLLGDLRMQYVQLVRATEEQLKQQAAQKFSAGDILGKK